MIPEIQSILKQLIGRELPTGASFSEVVSDAQAKQSSQSSPIDDDGKASALGPLGADIAKPQSTSSVFARAKAVAGPGSPTNAAQAGTATMTAADYETAVANFGKRDIDAQSPVHTLKLGPVSQETAIVDGAMRPVARLDDSMVDKNSGQVLKPHPNDPRQYVFDTPETPSPDRSSASRRSFFPAGSGSSEAGSDSLRYSPSAGSANSQASVPVWQLVSSDGSEHSQASLGSPGGAQAQVAGAGLPQNLPGDVQAQIAGAGSPPNSPGGAQVQVAGAGLPHNPPGDVQAQVVEHVNVPDNEPLSSLAYAMFAGSASNAIASGMSFGLKPFVEAGFDKLSITLGADEDTAKLISNIMGGVFVGVVHNAVSASIGAWAKGQLGATAYTDTSESALRRELNEIGTVGIPVVAAFTGTYAAGGALLSQSGNIWANAAFRSVQSIAGGFIQGAVTTAMQNSMDCYRGAHVQEIDLAEASSRFRAQMTTTFSGDSGAQKLLKQGIGKVVGASAGMVAATYVGPAAASSMQARLGGAADAVSSSRAAQAAGSAAGMLAFLGGWFGGIHAGSASGHRIEQSRAQGQAQAEDIVMEPGEGAV